jgi:hyperosmotically inducible protein
MNRPMVHITLVSLLLLAAVGCRSMTGQSLGTNIDNKTTTATVKARLAADQLQNLTWVDVDTSAGTVYLTGTASSEAQKRRAEEVARSVGGVREVVNNIQVRPGVATGAASASPATTSAPGRQLMTGQVTRIDHGSGQVTLQTGQGDLLLQLPPGAVAGVQQGDRVTVELGVQPRP